MRGGREPTPDAYRRGAGAMEKPAGIDRPATDRRHPAAEEEPSEPSEPADQGGSSSSKPDADE